jgi:hypothetical protein
VEDLKELASPTPSANSCRSNKREMADGTNQVEQFELMWIELTPTGMLTFPLVLM